MLDLAGHVLDHTGQNSLLVFRPEAVGVTLTIRDSSEGQTGEIRHTGGKKNGEGQFLYAECRTDPGVKCVLESGTVSGFRSSECGSVCLAGRSVFEMRGGTIRDCQADKGGGAVFLWTRYDRFTFTGGVISNCMTSTSKYSYGGAVGQYSGTFEMSSNAVITTCSSQRGGGLYVSGLNATATIDGGMITNCCAIRGGGVLLYGGASVTMNGGEIVGNVVSLNAYDEGWGAAVFADIKSFFTFNGGRIANNAATNGASWVGGVAMCEGSALTMNGGEIVGCRANNGNARSVYASKSSASRADLNAGLFDDETVTNAESRATLPAGYALASFAGVEGTRYIVASNATFNTDGELNGGTLRFDPRSEPYESAGLRVAEGFAVVKVNRTEWTLREECFTVNGTPMSAGTGSNPNWNIDGDGDLHLTSENGAYVLAGVADSVRVSAEANGQNVTLGGFTNTCSESETYAVGAGVASNTLCLAGINALAATGAGEPAISVADGATLSIGAKEGAQNGAKNGFLFAQGGESSAAIRGKGSRVAINGGTLKANGGFDATGVGTGIDAAEVFAADGMVVRAGTDEDPIDEVEHASEKTDIASILVGQCFVTATPPVEIPTEPILAEPTAAPENATLAVYTNGVLSAETSAGSGVWNAWSNQTAEVVYKANDGYRFSNGETVVTNTLDTTTDPAVNAAGEVPPTSTGKPKVLLGVVAQRYPWNRWLDIQYKTPYADASVTVTFKASGVELGTAQGTCGKPATASFDLNAVAEGAFRNKQLKSVKITATINLKGGGSCKTP